jgi:hypothetical protein
MVFEEILATWRLGDPSDRVWEQARDRARWEKRLRAVRHAGRCALRQRGDVAIGEAVLGEHFARVLAQQRRRAR